MARLITLLTDFGLRDGYEGVMKGVIKTICPGAEIIDLTHEVAGQDVAAGSFLLGHHYRYFPAGSIHVAVIDPGVGTSRRVLIAEAGEHTFLAPDNGLLSFLPQNNSLRLFEANEPRFWLERVSHTFHARDIFAPLAAHLANGRSGCELGRPIAEMQRLSPDPPEWVGNTLLGRIVYKDKFGNLISNIASRDLAKLREQPRVVFEDRDLGLLARSYAASPVGKPLAVVGGFDRLEVAVNGGSAAALFKDYQKMRLKVF